MIVVLVYRPEAADGGDANDPEADRFDGIEVYGVYMDAENRAVMEMVNGLKDANPKWQFCISNEKLKVGFPSTLEGKKK